jgi:purine-binding chemotaxis protein CheW
VKLRSASSEGSGSAATNAGTPSPYLVVAAGRLACAVHLAAVLEILEAARVTAIPGTPPWVRGALELRGVILPVVDLAPRLGLPPSPRSGRHSLLILEYVGPEGPGALAVLVKAVLGVVGLAPDAWVSHNESEDACQADCIRAVTRTEHGLVHLLGGARILDPEQPLVAGESAVAAEIR